MVPTTTLIRSIALVVMTPAAPGGRRRKESASRLSINASPAIHSGRARTDRSDPLPSAGQQSGHCRWLQLFGGDARLRNNLEQRHARKISG
jgi:hypothetical protein